jgi:hypothetical protein
MHFASQRNMHKTLSHFVMFFNAVAENLKGSSIKVGSGAYFITIP